MFDLGFYYGKKVLVTGHTGFKGTWLCKVLVRYGADVVGYALEAATMPSLYNLLDMDRHIKSVIGDIRDYEKLSEVFEKEKPEIVFHLAAQPIVLEGYKNPRTTYETNVMGTVNILECVRKVEGVKSFLNVTTDKVYLNKEWEWGYREYEELDGFDPYSNSKSCSELVTHCYRNSFFNSLQVPVSTVRAGNVIGGGDFSENRIIPDCVRAALRNEEILIRNPHSTRPYQHVLEPIYAYLMIATKQYDDFHYVGYYNVGPDENDCFKTEDLVKIFVNAWGGDLRWKGNDICDAPHEANFLKLDCSKLKSTFGWRPYWNLTTAIEKTVEWNKCWMKKGNINECMDRQIQEFLNRE